MLSVIFFTAALIIIFLVITLFFLLFLSARDINVVVLNNSPLKRKAPATRIGVLERTHFPLFSTHKNKMLLASARTRLELGRRRLPQRNKIVIPPKLLIGHISAQYPFLTNQRVRTLQMATTTVSQFPTSSTSKARCSSGLRLTSTCGTARGTKSLPCQQAHNHVVNDVLRMPATGCTCRDDPMATRRSTWSRSAITA